MSRVRANVFTNLNADGAPTFPNGAVSSGVVTAVTFSGNVSGDISGNLTGTGVSISGITTTSNLVVQNSAYTAITTTNTGKIIINREYCTAVTSIAGTNAGIAITLPPSPQPGWEVGVAVGGTFLDTVVGRNGSNIMGIAEDMTLDREYISVQLVYVDSTVGWRFF